ncbi:hypothetical protein K493DRAFT_83995 [Basidiobolus meristosporus CBS 931.73]|uniref:L-lactate dehydrogenase (cytochrome) n=1 Tax=Basidiobolus meristosporus CBS 931.73 TaxID=1314790 RepID=A0A1Y1YW78_9FUNG|nr:hypothetical protein K493DRAFT_83995 [Basidiobolus meristosporus CBS 931.73]|eukprot:ORY02323.1 hypothetical protein K493DRAFT_83995 [Basidiobolus meristosporus CBS 931.73]
MKLISASDVAKHDSQKSCWMIIHGKVYDLTNFLEEHPGGKKILLKYAGKDATEAFDPIHPKDIIAKYLPPEVCLGEIDVSTIVAEKKEETPEEKARQLAIQNKPHISEMLNLHDFEAVAKQVLRADAWAYYSSGADDEITLRENHNAFHRIWLKPRVMVNVTHVDMSTKLLGYDSSFPLYITACALGKLGHPEGEVILTRAANKQKIIQLLPTLASCSLDEMVNASVVGQILFYQLYVNSDRKISEQIVRTAEAKGCKALFITVDAPQLGRREKDMRQKFVINPPDMQDDKDLKTRDEGAARAISKFIDPGLCWEDIKWFKSITRMPIIIKGIQSAEDSVLAWQHGCQGIVISNHGGRQLDTSPSAIEILPSAIAALKAAGADLNKFEVYIDGGIRRGSDIFKAIALGAKAVGLGRPTLYGMSTYGEAGVERVLQLLKDEFEMVMRLMGVTSIDQITPDMVDIRNLGNHISTVPRDYLSSGVYDKMLPRRSKL